jgi:putative ABC transport system ATP-binding protein
MDLLISLNRKDGITLVMVTHDVSMKFFADRVIWLRDGKIQRIEVVSEEKKNETITKLSDKLHEIRSRQQKNEMNKQKHQQQSHSSSLPPQSFIVRKPQDYKTHPHYVPGSVTLTDFTTVMMNH